MKPVIVNLIDDAKEEYEKLAEIVKHEKETGISNSENQQLLKSINQKIEQIKLDPQFGSPVSKKLIEKTLLPVDNLWVVDLTGYWRMLYTLKGSHIEILCFILKLCDHDEYDKIFGYRKK